MANSATSPSPKPNPNYPSTTGNKSGKYRGNVKKIRRDDVCIVSVQMKPKRLIK